MTNELLPLALEYVCGVITKNILRDTSRPYTPIRRYDHVITAVSPTIELLHIASYSLYDSRINFKKQMTHAYENVVPSTEGKIE